MARLSSGTTRAPQGLDASLLWVPMGHVALVSAVLDGTLTELANPYSAMDLFMCVPPSIPEVW